MKIQIEQSLKHSDISANEFNRIVNIALSANDLNDLIYKLDGDIYKHWRYGLGGNHCWVKQVHGRGNLYQDRTLFITQ